MSYGPPQKTRYGDEDFIKEDWNPQQPTAAGLGQPPPSFPIQTRQQNFGQSGLASTAPQPVYGQQQQPVGYNNDQRANAASFVEATKTLTQDDILFMRSWRQDSFYYRVLPLTVVGSGALFFYNKSKNLPHKPLKYFLLNVICYTLGKWSYRGELKRRLEASPLTTPYMQAMRKLVGVQQIGEGGSFVSEDFAHPQYDQNLGYTLNPLPTNHETTNQTMYTNPSDISSNTSYEELRARNRGLVK